MFKRISLKFGSFLTYLKKRWLRIGALLIVLIAGVFIYRNITREPEGITSYKVNRTDLVSSFSANGSVKAKNEVNLKFYSPGRVTWVGVKNGDTVYAGQRVASLNTTSLNAAYKMSLNDQRNTLASKEKVLDEVQGHERDETFAQRSLRTTAEVASDNAYEASIIARDNLRNAVLISPIAGSVVFTNNLIEGMNLSGSDIETMFIRVIDLNSLYFEANVDEIDYSKVRVGQEVDIIVDAYPTKSCRGIVSYFARDGRKTAGGVVTIPTEINLTDCGIDYAIGLNGQANFVLDKLENTLVIPKKYIVNKDGTDNVWKQTGKATKNRELVPVTVGMTSATDAQITEGLSEGDTVIFIP